MADAYAIIKAMHVSLAVISGAFFALRGLLGLPAPRLARHVFLRRLSYGIDTALLLSALALLVVLHFMPLTSVWLWTKLAFLVAYIGLGYQAFNGAYPAKRRLFFYLGALACFVMMFSIAQHQNPLGPLHFLLR